MRAAAGIAVVLLPNDHGGIASSSETGSAQLVRRQRQIRVTPEMRSSIDALLDEFVPRAIARRDPGSVRPFVTPTLWRQATPAEWRGGTIPVPPFDPAGTTFHGWRTIYASEHVAGGSRGRLSSVWILVPVALLSLIVIIPLAVFTHHGGTTGA